MLEEEYESLEAIPADYRHLYVKVGDVYKLVAAGQIKSQADITKLQNSLESERNAHKETKAKLAKFNGLDPEEVHQKLDRYDELEASAGGNLDETKINTLVEARIKSRVAPLERQVTELTNQLTEKDGQVTEFKNRETRRTIHDHIRKAGTEAKMLPEAIDDALMYGERIFDVQEGDRVIARDGVGVTPGIGPDVWLSEMKRTRAHWWPQSAGVGATGGKGGVGGTNPFTFENWNMTEQGKLVNENRALAEQYAKAAGTSIGGQKPQPKK